jgi:hypothetical protein
LNVQRRSFLVLSSAQAGKIEEADPAHPDGREAERWEAELGQEGMEIVVPPVVGKQASSVHVHTGLEARCWARVPEVADWECLEAQDRLARNDLGPDLDLDLDLEGSELHVSDCR